MRDRYRIYQPSDPHYVTCTVVAWLAVFTRPEIVQVILDSWKYLQKEKRLTLFGYVIMENHLHFVASAANLSKELQSFKSFTAKKIVEILKQKTAYTMLQELSFFKARHKTESDHQLWQEGNHPILIPNEDVLRQKLEYSHNNPLRRGYVEEAVHWRYSSARNYAGKPGLIEVTTDW